MLWAAKGCAIRASTSRLRVLTARHLNEVLDPEELVESIASAMVALTERGVSMPPRQTISAPEHKVALVMMAAHAHGGSTITAKLSSRARARSPAVADHREALVAVFDARTGVPVAIMDGNFLTTMRTAASSRLATRLLANEDAGTVAILGSGQLAEAHGAAMLRERPLRELRVVGRDVFGARAMARRLAEDTDTPVVVCHSYEHALSGADIVCAATASPLPVVRREWLSDGVHLNSIGCVPGGREIAPEVVRDALVVVDDLESALAPEPDGANDITFAISDGIISPGHVRLELGDLVRDRATGRRSPAQITLYKSVGVGAQDDAAASLALAIADARDIGVIVEL